MSKKELTTELANILSEYFGVPRIIAQLRRRPFCYRSSYAIEDLEAVLDDGTRLSLLFKNLSRPLRTTRSAKPELLLNPLREIETYRHILRPNGVGAPICYGAVDEPLLGRFWLFLEKVKGTELYQVGDFATWRQVARWLARLHLRFAGAAADCQRAAPLLRYDSGFYLRWLERAIKFNRRTGSSRLIERLASRYDRVTSRLAPLKPTFIHGEFYASNVLVRQSPDGLEVCPVDWETAAIGPGLMDLAALIAGHWGEYEKRCLAMDYFAALADDGVSASAPDEFLQALDYCRLQVAVQWLGWSPRWTPPPDHANDWLNEAAFLGEKLEII